MSDADRIPKLADLIRRFVSQVIRDEHVPRSVWGVVSAKTVDVPPRYTFTPEGSAVAFGGTFPYLGANPPANGETVMGWWIGADLFLVLRRSGTS